MKTTADAPAARRPAGVPAAADVLARSGGENFPVASWVLGRRARSDLLAIYGFARLVDELGDTLEGDRLRALDWVEQELDRAFRGEAATRCCVSLQPVLRARSLPREPFARLIEANRVDQRVSRYETWEQLQGYCRLSADPVGELVLGVFGAADPWRVRLSDSICTGLQLAEHLQDVAEDRAAGGSTCRWRTSPASAPASRTFSPPAPVRALRARGRLRGGPGARACCGAGGRSSGRCRGGPASPSRASSPAGWRR